MKKITKKEFIEILCNNSSLFMGSVFRWNDGKIKDAIDKMEKINGKNIDKTSLRTVKEKHSNFIVFSNGSRLDFNQVGEKEYFEYWKDGTQFVWQRTKHFDNFDNSEYLNYVVYAIIQDA